MSQNYTPTEWIDNRTVGTASVMNNMEKCIEYAHDSIYGIKNDSLLKDENMSGFYIAPFFASNSDLRTFLYKSYDGKEFFRSKNPIATCRDSDIIYKNGKFYLVSFPISERENGYFTDEFTIQVSENLVDWERHDISLGMFEPGQGYVSYAPEWFVDDNDDIYVFFPFSTEMHSDGIRRKFKQYYTKCLDLENLVFDKPKMFEVNGWNLIDPHIVKKDGIYYMFIKTETDDADYNMGEIQIWTSTNLDNWTYVKTIESLKTSKYEAPCVQKIGDVYYLYVDNYSNDDHINAPSHMHYCTSTDLLNWSNPIKITCNYPTRHGTVLHLTDSKAISVVNNNVEFETNPTVVYRNLLTPYTSNKYLKLFDVNFDTTWKTCSIKFSLSDVQGNFFNSDFSITIKRADTFIDIRFNETYNVISDLSVVACAHDLDNISIYLETKNISNANPSLTNVEYTSFECDCRVCKDNILIDNIEGTLYYPIRTSSNFSENETVNINSLRVNGVISSLSLQSNKIYYVFEDTVIENVDVSKIKNGDIVYFSLFNDNFGINLTLKNGSTIFCPGNVDFVINKEKGLNEGLFAFMKVGEGIRKI